MWRIFYSPPISVAHPCHMLVLDSLAVAMEGGRGGAGRQVASGAVRRPWRGRAWVWAGRAWVCPRIGLVKLEPAPSVQVQVCNYFLVMSVFARISVQIFTNIIKMTTNKRKWQQIEEK
jgi:hypothetical protein